MLDQLVESKSNSKENTRRSGFLLVVLVVMVSILLSSVTYSLFAKEFAITDDLSLTTLIAPVPVADEEPPPKEEKQPDKQVAADTRKELIASIDMSPKEPPKEISVQKMTKATIRPEFNTVLGDRDSNTTVRPEGGGRVVTEGGPGGGLPVSKDTEKNTDEEAPPPPPKPKPKTISGGVLNGKARSLPQPAYPPAAKAIRAGGSVSVQILIDENGRVVSASAVSGHPLLRAAAVSAAQRASFSPTLLSGQPVKVSGVITYNFNVQ